MQQDKAHLALKGRLAARVSKLDSGPGLTLKTGAWLLCFRLRSAHLLPNTAYLEVGPHGCLGLGPAPEAQVQAQRETNVTRREGDMEIKTCL